MWWSSLTGPLCASLLVTLVALACGGADPRRPSDGPQGGPAAAAAAATPGGVGGGGGGGGSYGNRQYHKIQHGQCSYTFILPEETGGGSAAAAGGGPPCREGKGGGGGSGGGGSGGARAGVGTATGAGVRYNTNALQRDAPPPPGEQDFPSQKIQHLEHIMDNYTQWLHKIESYIRESMKTEMAQLQQSAVHNHTAAMLEMGTNLLSQTAEQTRKLTDVETQVLNQTSRLEIQLLENSLSTNKLEKELMVQTNQISKLHDKNGLLEQKMLEMEVRHQDELERLRLEKGSLQSLVGRQTGVIKELETQLNRATGNSTALQRQQQEMMDTVTNLISLCSKDAAVPNSTKKAEVDKKHRDCADVYQAGFHKNGVYTIYVTPQETKKVYCNMESAGGGWTVVQRREDGSVDFQRTWKEYKMGFGNAAGEHWLGNEFMFLLSSQRPTALRVELTDWNGHQAFSLYDRFLVGSEKQNYRLSLKSHSGTAGRQSSLVIHGADFSTTDMDNDSCLCKCALMLTGGWWFDACGPSNLNGMYFAEGQHIGKLNGIKWHYFKGPSYSLRATTMMIRPLDFT